jgi:hypothetical protein
MQSKKKRHPKQNSGIRHRARSNLRSSNGSYRNRNYETPAKKSPKLQTFLKTKKPFIRTIRSLNRSFPSNPNPLLIQFLSNTRSLPRRRRAVLSLYQFRVYLLYSSPWSTLTGSREASDSVFCHSLHTQISESATEAGLFFVLICR